MRSRAIAAGMAVGVVGLFANAAPAAANSGGMAPEAPNPGGGVAAKGPHTVHGSGGVTAEAAGNRADKSSSPAAKVQYILRHEHSNTPWHSLTLDPEKGDPGADGAQVVATQKEGSGTGEEIVNPIAIFSADGARIVAYIGRKGEKSAYTMPVDEAEVTEYIGNLAVPVDNPLEFVEPHTLHLTPDSDRGTVGFTAENGADFGIMP